MTKKLSVAFLCLFTAGAAFAAVTFDQKGSVPEMVSQLKSVSPGAEIVPLPGDPKALAKWIMTGVLAVGLTAAGFFTGRETILQPQTPTEIAKLFKFVALYQKSPCKIVYNGNTFEFEKLVDRARHYIVSCYRG